MRAGLATQLSELYMLSELELATGMVLAIFMYNNITLHMVGWRLAGLGPDWGPGDRVIITTQLDVAFVNIDQMEIDKVGRYPIKAAKLI